MCNMEGHATLKASKRRDRRVEEHSEAGHLAIGNVGCVSCKENHYIYIFIYICVCVCVCIYIYIYIYIYMYTYVYVYM